MKTELGLDERDPGCFLRTYSVVMVLRKVREALGEGTSLFAGHRCGEGAGLGLPLGDIGVTRVSVFRQP